MKEKASNGCSIIKNSTNKVIINGNCKRVEIYGNSVVNITIK